MGIAEWGNRGVLGLGGEYKRHLKDPLKVRGARCGDCASVVRIGDEGHQSGKKWKENVEEETGKE